MANQNIVDVVEGLIRLATNNQSEAEARQAALKACQLIQKFSIPLGAEVKIVRDAKWTPPSSDFMETVEDILKGTNKSPYQGQENVRNAQPADVSGSLSIRDNEVSTREDAFRAQMTRAWRAIREERRKIEAWVHSLKIQHRQDHWQDHPKPWGDK